MLEYIFEAHRTGRNRKILWGNVNDAALLAFLEVIGESRQGIIAKTNWDNLKMTLRLFKGFPQHLPSVRLILVHV